MAEEVGQELRLLLKTAEVDDDVVTWIMDVKDHFGSRPNQHQLYKSEDGPC